MSQPEPAPQNPPPSGTLGGCALFAIGMLFLIPSGLCTAFGGIGLVVEMVSNPQELVSDFDDYFSLIAITLTCLAIGIALVWAGIKLRR